MPSRDFQNSPAAPNGVSSGLLKRHKTLPHPRGERLSDVYPSYAARKPRVLSVDTGIPSSPTSQSSSPRTLKHTSRRIGAPDLPPTPPAHSRQSSSGSAVLEHTASHHEIVRSPSIPTTPTNHQSPPTPEVTPPRATARQLVSRPPITERYPSSGYPSSRNDSFKTAREDLSSEDEDGVSTIRPNLPSTRPSQVEVPQATARPFKSREIGLGLGLESDSEATPIPEESRSNGYFSRSKVVNDFGTFDGEWGSTAESSEVEPEWDHNLMRNVTVRRRRDRDSHRLSNGTPSGEVLDDNIVTPTNATKLLRKYPILTSLSSNPMQIDLIPSIPTRQQDSPTTPDVRRFSDMSVRSATSTVVEAMVVDTPPQRRKTLRHTKKQPALRSFSAEQYTVADPNHPVKVPHRLVHKSSGIFSRKHHSLGSVGSTSSSARSRREIMKDGSIPVVVVPERRSSVKTRTPSLRSTNSRKTKRSLSLNSAPLSQSSHANDPGYFDIPKRNPRRLSESAASSGTHSEHTIDFPPTIPMRRSSLSAPTSRNTSRAASLTAESLKAHNIIQTQVQTPQPYNQLPVEAPKDTSHLAPRASVDHNGDPFFGNRLSAQVTPFSQASYETTGTSAAELAQATSVTLYPHHNRSVLVVEQQAQPGMETQQMATDAASKSQGEVIRTKVPDPVTPPQQQLQQMDELDSPLRNPRDAPQPPAIKFIPPTPNVMTPTQEDDRQLRTDERPSTADQKPKRGLSLLRRALSNRRHSVAIISRTFSAKRVKDDVDESTQTSKGLANPSTLYPSVIDQPADESKLHPFWRPARFWDDLEDDDNEHYIDHDPYPRIDNRPTLPKRSLSDSLKRTFAILPIRDDSYKSTPWTERRTVQRTGSGNLRVVKNRGSRSSSDSLRRTLSGSHSYYTSEPHPPPARDTNNDLGRVWAGFRGIGRRISEKRRERRNEKLRKSISGPRDAVDGVARVISGDRENNNVAGGAILPLGRSGTLPLGRTGTVIRRKPVPVQLYDGGDMEMDMGDIQPIETVPPEIS